jgi:hypothetical protein
MSNISKQTGGVYAFAVDVVQQAAEFGAERAGKRRFILWIGERYGNIRLQDVRHPLRFFKQLISPPPLVFGVAGYKKGLVEGAEDNPARHYTAFVFVGFWLPGLLGLFVLYAWEVLGFFRYRGHWSAPDVRIGKLGLQHGAQVRRYGPQLLPALIIRDLAATAEG